MYIYLDETWDGPAGPFLITFNFGGGSWPAGSHPQPMPSVFFVNENTADCAGEGAAVQAAAGTWSQVECSDFMFRYGGSTSKTVIARDGENTVLWRDFGNLAQISSCTVFWDFEDQHTIVEFDIEFNERYSWSTTGEPTAIDVQNAATHALGHVLPLLDLWGTEDTEKVMCGYIEEGETYKRTLSPDDMEGIRWIYPACRRFLPVVLNRG